MMSQMTEFERNQPQRQPDWPEEMPVVTKGKWPNSFRYYQTPIGELPSVTTCLGALGLKTQPLVKWSGDVERQAALEVSGRLHVELAKKKQVVDHDNFVTLAHARMGEGRAHTRALAKAGNIGTEIHEHIRWKMKALLGDDAPELPFTSDQAQWAFMAWEDWWNGSGLKPVRVEQAIYHPGDEVCPPYAGAFDLLAQDPDGLLVLPDYKSSKGIYLDHHLQLAAYKHAARNFAPVDRAIILRVPKDVNDPEFEVRELGHHIDWQKNEKRLSEEDLMAAFSSAVTAFNILMAE